MISEPDESAKQAASNLLNVEVTESIVRCNVAIESQPEEPVVIN